MPKHRKRQGVVCVDTLTGTTSADYWARGQLELLCQKGHVMAPPVDGGRHA